ncbi:MAG: AAA family ATPase [Hydrogenibacillus schlegelii]|nr:AAA family ATPase [Hydrogenibacillus schlegelii]
MWNGSSTFDPAREPRSGRLIERIAASGRAAHAYLFYGPPGSGKREAARRLAALLLGRPLAEAATDVRWVEADGPLVGIDDVRAWIEWVHRAPLAGARRVVVVEQAERLTREAQNALLKVLEEPPTTAHFVLLTARPGRLLPTVRSRLYPVPFSAADSGARLLSALAEGGLSVAGEGRDGSAGAGEKTAAGAASGEGWDDVLHFLCHLPATPGRRLQAYTALVRKAGADPAAVLGRLLVAYRDVLVLATGGEASLVLASARPCLERLAARLGPAGAARVVVRLMEALAAVREHRSPAWAEALVMELEGV